MKTVFLFAFLAVLFVSASASADDPTDLLEDEQGAKNLADFLSVANPLSNTPGAPSDPPAPEPFKRCVAVRCPIKCWICICKCIKWA